MSADQFWDAAWKIGLPFVMVILAIISSKAGIWVWGSQLTYEREQFVRRLEDERKRADEIIRQKDEELRVYHDIAIAALERGERVADVGEQAVGLAERQASRRRR